MRIGIADARRRFEELLDHVGAGETVEITRRREIVASVAPPSQVREPDTSLADLVDSWRHEWGVGSWPDEEPFAGMRKRSAGRGAPW